MPRLGPIKRKDLIGYLSQYGFKGPFSGGKHQFTIKDDVTLRIPNPHRSDIGKELLVRILRQARIDKADWEKL